MLCCMLLQTVRLSTIDGDDCGRFAAYPALCSAHEFACLLLPTPRLTRAQPTACGQEHIWTVAGAEGVRLYELAQSASGGPGGNPTVSDFFYLALALGKIEVEVCDDLSFEAGAVTASTGKRIETELCIKNFGESFEPWLESCAGSLQG